MSSLSAKDRVPLCLFTFTDGRRCRTPRTGNHPHFCFYHAQKETRAQAADKLGKDLAYFFSGDYLSACDLSTAMARLIPAVVRGDIKPKLARTIAYMVQTLMQTIHLSQDEYINAFSTDGWRKAVRNSVNQNSDYHNPQPDEGDEPDESRAQSSTPPPTQASTPNTTASSPRASSATSPSAAANPRSPQPNSAPPSAEPAASPAVQTPQPASPTAQPTASDAALCAARSVPTPQHHSR